MQDIFQARLNDFEKIISGYPPIDKVRSQLQTLRASAFGDKDMLSEHQVSAILSRVDNYLANQYGEQVKRKDNRSAYSKSLN